jgi:hypothetical protein
MKQLLSLLLLLVPCLAWAQYPSNGNQKITLGEQTTADGLIYRGVASDTTLTAKSDTAAYFVLDTVNKKLYFYKISSTPKWNEISGSGGGGSTLDTATMLLPYYRAGKTGIIQVSDVPTLNQNTTGSAATLTTSRTFQTNLASTSPASFNGSANVTPGVTGTLGVGNGGTGATTFGAVNNIPFTSSSGSLTTDTNFVYTNATSRLGLGTKNPTEKLHVDGNGLFTGSVNANSLSLTTALSVANGGTNRTTMPAGYILHGDGTSVDTAIGLFWDRTNRRLGVGTNSPLNTFDIRGQTRFDNAIFGLTNNTSINIGQSGFESNYTLVGRDAYWGIKYTNSPAGAHSFGIDVYNSNSPKNALTILNNGEILMGYTTDQGTSILSVNGNVSANGSVLTSDQRFKENITPLNKGLEIINKLKPVTFNFINDTDNNFSEFEEVGFIAQDVDKALSTETFVKSIVKYTDESNIDSKMVISPHNLIPILTKAIQEQQAQIEALKQRLLILENK